MAWTLPMKLGWLDGEPRKLPVSSSPAAGLCATIMLGFLNNLCAGDPTSVLMPVWQALCQLRHLPSSDLINKSSQSQI